MVGKSVVIGTAGHIDHGKTALVRALTGIETDRLPEEKRRGITIDLGFAFLDAGPLRISFVDVPGHSLFIHNMLAGSGCIGAVMLVISAEEGVKPQTVEHLAICELLGVRAGLTVITKADAVDSVRAAEVERSVKNFLKGSFLDQADVVTVSAFTGQNLALLRQKLIELAEQTPDADLTHVPRLPIDRAFVIKGFGTVVTGTLLSGTLSTGQSLALEPGGKIVRVRGLETHGQAQEMVEAGSRVALNLSGVEVSEVSRGQTLVVPKTLTAVSSIDVEAWLLSHASALKHGSTIHFHAFSSNTLADVLLYGGGRLEAGTRRLARLKLHHPIVLTENDPFVLRQVSPADTIGGGRVLDAFPLPKLRRMQALGWLEKMRVADPEERGFLRIARRGYAGLSLDRLVQETGLVECKMDSGRVVRIPGEILLVRAALEEACEAMLRVVEQHPAGIRRSELRSKLSLRLPIFDFSLENLAGANRLRLKGEMVLPWQAIESTSALDSGAAAVAEVYRQAGLSAPLVSEVALKLKRKDPEIRALITLLLRQKILVPMGSENLFIHHEPLAQLRSQISQLRGKTIDVAQMKQMTGLSRKYVIPLLEYLDRQMVTRKSGESRLVL